jgi:hypothetical protein
LVAARTDSAETALEEALPSASLHLPARNINLPLQQDEREPPPELEADAGHPRDLHEAAALVEAD